MRSPHDANPSDAFTRVTVCCKVRIREHLDHWEEWVEESLIWYFSMFNTIVIVKLGLLPPRIGCVQAAGMFILKTGRIEQSQFWVLVQIANHMLGRLQMLLGGVAHEFAEYTNSKTDVRSCVDREVEQGANHGFVLIVLWQRHTYLREDRAQGHGSILGVAFAEMESVDNAASVFFLRQQYASV
jgi:hypothetical protein